MFTYELTARSLDDGNCGGEDDANMTGGGEEEEDDDDDEADDRVSTCFSCCPIGDVSEKEEEGDDDDVSMTLVPVKRDVGSDNVRSVGELFPAALVL